MPDEPRRPALDLTSGVTQLGDTVATIVAADLDELVAASGAGAAVVVVPVAFGALPELVEAAAGRTLVLSGPVDCAHLLALDLVAAGAPPGHLVVEAVVAEGADAPTAERIEKMRGAGLLVGAVLAAGTDGSLEDEGWEIAMCTRLLAAGVQTLRNVDPPRVRRVQAVVDAIRSAVP